jgi:NAD(P)-dependent dehydrogenase (short-subunit alcohol dehydrogenase family)
MVNQEVAGKRIIITGANSGIGFGAAKALSKKGAKIILAVRNEQKGKVAAKAILKENPQAVVEVLTLDLADLASVRDFAENFMKRFDSLDILINNAGVMLPPYQLTKDGFELQFGSNHLGHFALTGLLLPLLKQTANSRVVSLSSIAHKGASIYFNNLDGSKGYKGMRFYGQSKLATLLFAKEFDQRLKQHGISTISLASHPGLSSTNLFKFGKGDTNACIKAIMPLFFQSAEMGSLPTIYAVTENGLKGGEYIGPRGIGGIKGKPTIEIPAAHVYHAETMKKLWEVSEKLTGVTYDFSLPKTSNLGA